MLQFSNALATRSVSLSSRTRWLLIPGFPVRSGGCYRCGPGWRYPRYARSGGRTCSVRGHRYRQIPAPVKHHRSRGPGKRLPSTPHPFLDRAGISAVIRCFSSFFAPGKFIGIYFGRQFREHFCASHSRVGSFIYLQSVGGISCICR